MGRQIGSILIAVLYFLVHGPAVYAQETSFWAQRRQRGMGRSLVFTSASIQTPLTRLPVLSLTASVDLVSTPVAKGLSPEFFQSRKNLMAALARAPGTVRKISIPPTFSPASPVVVHIQDVHGNEQAQRRIGEAIESLVSEKTVDLVALEGTAGPLSLQRFRDYKNREAVHRTAEMLLREQKISGPIYSALTGSGPWPDTVGVEVPSLYRANVDAYRGAAPVQDKIRARMALARSRVESQKKSIYSPALFHFDQTVRAYADRRLSLGDYVRALPGGVGFPTLARFREAVGLERSLDFSKVEVERARLISEMQRRLPRPEVESLVAEAGAFRSGLLRPAAFYKRLRNRAHRFGITGEDAPHLAEYFRYVNLADEIDVEQLMTELAEAEKQTYDRLAVTVPERNLMERSRRLYLSEQLVEFSLTPSEWGEYVKLSSQRIPALTPNEKKSGPLPRTAHPFEKTALTDFENFYRSAQRRDLALSATLLGLMEKGENPGKGLTGVSPGVFRRMNIAKRRGDRPFVGVLVTGGFHAQGVTERLNRAGVCVVSFVPRLEKIEIDKGAVSFGIFTREKTPLEKMFQKEKLFLAAPPVQSSTLNIFIPAVVTMMTYLVGGALADHDAATLYSTLLAGLGTVALVQRTPEKALSVVETNRKRIQLILKRLSRDQDSVEQRELLPRFFFIHWIARCVTGALAVVIFSITLGTATGIAKPSLEIPLPRIPVVRMAANHKKPGTPRKGSSGSNDMSAVTHLAALLRGAYNLVVAMLPSLRSDQDLPSQAQNGYKRQFETINRYINKHFSHLKWVLENEEVEIHDFTGLWFYLNRYFFFPNKVFLPDFSLSSELNEVRWSRPVPFLNWTLHVVDARPPRAKESRWIFSSGMGLFGFAPVDFLAADRRAADLNKYLENKKEKGSEDFGTIEKKNLSYAILDLHLRILMARSKQMIYTGIKLDKSPDEVSGEDVVRELSLTPPDFSSREEGPLSFVSPAYSKQIHYELLDGFIETVRHLKTDWGDEKEACRASLFALFDLAVVERGRVRDLHHPRRSGLESFLKQIADAVQFQGDLNTPQGLEALLKEPRLNSFNDLWELLLEIRGDLIKSPEQRYEELYGVPPSENILEELYSNFSLTPEIERPLLSPSGEGARPTRRKQSLLFRGLMERMSRLPKEGPDKDIEESLRKVDAVLTQEAGLGPTAVFDQLGSLLITSGEKMGLLEQVKHHPNDTVRSYVVLLDSLLPEAADRAVSATLEQVNGQIGSGDFVGAIRTCLSLVNHESLLDYVPLRQSDVDGFLRSARVGFVQQAGQPPDETVSYSDLQELVGLDDKEVQWLQSLEYSGASESEAPPGFDVRSLRALRGRLGRFSPSGLGALITRMENGSLDATFEQTEFYISPDVRDELWNQFGAEVLKKINRFISAGKNYQEEHRLDHFPMMLGDHLLGRSVPNVLRFRVTDQLRVFVRYFPHENRVAIIGLENKGGISESASGRMDKSSVGRLQPAGWANGFGTSGVFDEYHLVPQQSVASMGDKYARQQWGLGHPLYVRYTRYLAPAWEWIYLVPGLNLLAQWGLSNWILSRFFPNANATVNGAVPYQVALSVLGLAGWVLGFLFGGWALLAGAVVNAMAMAHVFAEAHPERPLLPEEFRFRIGFLSGMALVGPSLILFLLDPIGLTGTGYLLALSSTLMTGFAAQFLVHSRAQDVRSSAKKGSVSFFDDRPARIGKSLLAVDKCLEVGDLEQADEALNRLNHLTRDIEPSTFLGRLMKDLSERVRPAETKQWSDADRAVAILLSDLEQELFEARNWTAFFQKFNLLSKEYAEQFESAPLQEAWTGVRDILNAFVEGRWDEADGLAQAFAMKGQSWLAFDGGARPYRERVVFGFLQDYWAQRALAEDTPSSSQEVKNLLRNMGAIEALTPEVRNKIQKGVVHLFKQDLSDIERAAVNEGLRRLESVSGDGHVFVRWVFTQKRQALSGYRPVLLVALQSVWDKNLDPQNFISRVQNLFGGRGFWREEGEWNRLMTLVLLNTQLLGRPLTSSGMHPVGGRLTKTHQTVFRLLPFEKADGNVLREWASFIETAQRHYRRGEAIRKWVGPVLDRFVEVLRMENPHIKTSFGDVPIEFRLLPGSWKDVVPGQPRAHWEFTIENGIVVYLRKDDLAAVIHEGVEVMFEDKTTQRPEGNPHTYAFVAEVLANPEIQDDLVPQRAYDQLDYMSPERLRKFLADSNRVYFDILARFPAFQFGGLNHRLKVIRLRLMDRAYEKLAERNKDQMDLFLLATYQFERNLELGFLDQAQEDLKVMERFLFHLRKERKHVAFLESVVARWRTRLRKDQNDVLKLNREESHRVKDFAFLLNRMELAFDDLDFHRLETTIDEANRWETHGLLPDQIQLLDLWRDVFYCLRPIMEEADWETSDQRMALFQKKWVAIVLQVEGPEKMYREGLLIDFFGAYWQQRDLRPRNSSVLFRVLSSLLRRQVTEVESTPVLLQSAMAEKPNNFEKAAISRALHVGRHRISEAIRWRKFLSDNLGGKTPNVHEPLFLRVLGTWPGLQADSWDKIKKWVSEGGHGRPDVPGFPGLDRLLAVCRQHLGDLESFSISPTATPDLDRIFNKDQGFFLVETMGILSGIVLLTLGISLMLGSLISGLVWVASVVGVAAVVGVTIKIVRGVQRDWAQAKKWGQIIRSDHPLNLDIEGKDLVRVLSGSNSPWFKALLRAQVGDKFKNVPYSAARWAMAKKVSPSIDLAVGPPLLLANEGARPLTVLYMDAKMIEDGSASRLATTVEQRGLLTVVPLDETARQWVKTAFADRERFSPARGTPLPTKGALLVVSEKFAENPSRSTDRVASLVEVEQELVRCGTKFEEFTSCRVVVPSGLVLDAEGVQSDLFKEALMILLNGMAGLVIKRKDLYIIDRAARAVVSSA